jgi:hypothetical protein
MPGMTKEELEKFAIHWLNTNSVKIAQELAAEVGPKITPEDMHVFELIAAVTTKSFAKYTPALVSAMIEANNAALPKHPE